MKAIILFLSLVTTAQAGTIQYADFQKVAGQITLNIATNPVTKEQFIFYKTNMRMSSMASAFNVCLAAKITDPQGTWSDTEDVSLAAFFSVYWRLPNGVSVEVGPGAQNWCTQ